MFEHILVPLDRSALAECVLPHVGAIAQAFDSRITVLHVMEHAGTSDRGGAVDPMRWRVGEMGARSYLCGITGRLQEADLRAEGVLMEGQAAEAILDFAHAQGVDLILLSSHGRSGLSAWNLSSVVQKVIMGAYMPLMIIRAGQCANDDIGDLRYRRLLVPLDGSRRAESVLPPATVLAQRHHSELLLTHVVQRQWSPLQPSSSQEEVKLVERLTQLNRLRAHNYLEQIAARLSCDVRPCLRVGESVFGALHNLIREEDVDLVLLCAHGCSGCPKWPYGGTVLNFIDYGTTPLLVLQDLPPGRVERSQAEIAAMTQGEPRWPVAVENSR